MSEKAADGPVLNGPFVLLVEDDNVFRELLSKELMRSGYIVRAVSNGLAAKTVFDLNKENILVVISDLKMPEFDGVALLKHVRSSSQIPFIVMTGFSELLDYEQANKLGANEFVPKPFRGSELLEVIDRCLRPPSEAIAEETKLKEEKKYCAIHISEFLTASVLQSDIYVRLQGEKYIRVAYKGDAVPLERLRKYQDKRVDYLYVTIGEFASYVEFSKKLTAAATKTKSISKETKAKLIKHTSEVVLAQCFLQEVDPEAVQPAARMVLDTLDLLTGDDDILGIFANLQSHADRVYSQGVAVATYSCLVAKANGWHGSATHFALVMGGLMKDIGLKEIPSELITKKRMHRTVDETKQFESHPTRGREILYQLQGVPEVVASIVHQHHENKSGTGYPQSLTGEAIHPLAKLVGTVDKFVNLMLPLEEGIEQTSPKTALFQMQVRMPEEIDQGCFNKLCEIFKFVPAQKTGTDLAS